MGHLSIEEGCPICVCPVQQRQQHGNQVNNKKCVKGGLYPYTKADPSILIRNGDTPTEWKVCPPIAANGFARREINDINNYWDSPRELKFSVRVKW